MSEGWIDGQWAAFRCAVCRHDQYVRVAVKRPTGHWYTTEFYSCCRCSVMFRDPVKFSLMMVENEVTKDMRPRPVVSAPDA